MNTSTTIVLARNFAENSMCMPTDVITATWLSDRANVEYIMHFVQADIDALRMQRVDVRDVDFKVDERLLWYLRDLRCFCKYAVTDIRNEIMDTRDRRVRLQRELAYLHDIEFWEPENLHWWQAARIAELKAEIAKLKAHEDSLRALI